MRSSDLGKMYLIKHSRPRPTGVIPGWNGNMTKLGGALGVPLKGMSSSFIVTRGWHWDEDWVIKLKER